MFKRSLTTMSLVSLMLSALLTGCAGESDDGKTLTYWASNQGKSAEQDIEILGKELAKFTRRTGIKVELEVVGWPDLLNRILGAATSGVGPDVVNLGNTWAASLQATGAFIPFDEQRMRQLGGRDRFLRTSMTSTGMPGRAPTSVPLYGLAYGVFYNKKMFQNAGITRLPETWPEFLDVARRITDQRKDRWGLTVPGASYTENAHFAFMFGKQHGANFISNDGQATFTSPGAVAAVQRYIELMSKNEVVKTDDAEISSSSEAVNNFTNGDAAMLIAQNSVIATIEANGMAESEWGVIPLPVIEPLAPGGSAVRSHVAGSNIAVFEDTDNAQDSMKLVEFLTSKEEQTILNKKYGSLPVVKDAYDDPAFQTAKSQVFSQVLAQNSEPVPMIPNESHFETTVGAAVRDLFAQAAMGNPVRRSDVYEALASAEQKMRGSGGTR